MTEEKLKQFEARRKEAVEAFDGLGDAGLYSDIVERDVPELIAAVRELQKPLAEQLGPTILVLEEMASFDSGEQECLALDAKRELTRLRTLTGREK